jgi:hypothetical protein
MHSAMHCMLLTSSQAPSLHRTRSSKPGKMLRRSMLNGGGATEQAALCEAALEVASAQAGATALLGLPMLRRPRGGLAPLMLRPAKIAGARGRRIGSPSTNASPAFYLVPTKQSTQSRVYQQSVYIVCIRQQQRLLLLVRQG